MLQESSTIARGRSLWGSHGWLLRRMCMAALRRLPWRLFVRGSVGRDL